MNLLIKVDCGVGVVMALKKCSEIQTISPVLCSPISVPHSKNKLGKKAPVHFLNKEAFHNQQQASPKKTNTYKVISIVTS